MKILLHTFEFFPFVGGISVYMHKVALSLCSLKHEVTLVCGYEKEDTDAIDNSFPYKVVRQQRGTIVAQTKDLLNIIRKDKVEYAIFGQYNSCKTAACLGIGNFCRYGVLFHGTEINYYQAAGRFLGRFLRWRFERLMRHATSFFFNSNYTKNLFYTRFNVDRRLDTIVGYGFTDDELSPKIAPELITALKKKIWECHEPGQLYTTIARLEDRKNHKAVIQALKLLPDDNHYAVAGIGPEENSLRKLSRTLNIENRVHFLGRISDDEKIALLNISDVFVMPGIELAGKVEGLGIAYLEASLHGIPVIASNTGGVSDAVKDKKTGILIPPGDDKSLFNAMLTAINQPELGAQGRRFIEENYTIGHMATALSRGLP